MHCLPLPKSQLLRDTHLNMVLAMRGWVLATNIQSAQLKTGRQVLQVLPGNPADHTCVLMRASHPPKPLGNPSMCLQLTDAAYTVAN